MKELPLELIATFASVAERASITAAAQELGTSKATVSKHIAELEARLGVILFARTTRSLSLTDIGATTLVRARRVLAEATAMLEDARETKSMPSGTIKLAAPTTFSQIWLAEIIPEFMAQYPDISLEISVDDRQIDLVEEGFDAALRINVMPDSSLVARQLAPIKRYLVASPAYWVAKGKPVEPSDLADHQCILYANTGDQATWKFRDADGSESRVKVNGPLIVNGGNIELPALRAGCGIGLMPDFSVWADIRDGRLEIAPVNWWAADLMLHLLTPFGRGKPRRLEVFTDFLVARFGGRPPPWDLSQFAQ
jgi:DNA-binding transcriptional LysR family regulator